MYINSRLQYLTPALFVKTISDDIPDELNVEKLFTLVRKLNNAREIQHLIRDSISLIEIRKICTE